MKKILKSLLSLTLVSAFTVTTAFGAPQSFTQVESISETVAAPEAIDSASVYGELSGLKLYHEDFSSGTQSTTMYGPTVDTTGGFARVTLASASDVTFPGIKYAVNQGSATDTYYVSFKARIPATSSLTAGDKAQLRLIFGSSQAFNKTDMTTEWKTYEGSFTGPLSEIQIYMRVNGALTPSNMVYDIDDVKIIVNPFDITFSDDGTTTPVKAYDGEELTLPEGKIAGFSHWTDGTNNYNAGDIYTVTGNKTLTSVSSDTNGFRIINEDFSQGTAAGTMYSATVNTSEGFARITLASATGVTFPGIKYPCTAGTSEDTYYISFKARIPETSSLTAGDKAKLRLLFNGNQLFEKTDMTATWQTYDATVTGKAPGEIQLYMRVDGALTPTNMVYDIDDFKVIMNPIEVTVSDGTSKTYKMYKGESLTLPNGTNTGFKYWTDGTNRYNAGANYTAKSSVTLTAVYGKPVKTNGEPGINLLTGTSDAFDFEDYPQGTATFTPFTGTYGSHDLSAFDGKLNLLQSQWAATLNTAAIANNTDKGNYLSLNVNLSASSGNIIELGIGDHIGNTQWRDQNISMIDRYPNTFADANRPVLVEFDTRTTSTDHHLRVTKNKNDNPQTTFHYTDEELESGDWVHRSTQFYANHSSTDTSYDTSTSLCGIFIVQLASANGNVFDYDNLIFMPYYKAEFYVGERLLTTKYFLKDNEGNIMTSYSPLKEFGDDISNLVPQGQYFAGWSTTNGGEAVDTIALSNADLTFHAVFEDISNMAPTSLVDEEQIRLNKADGMGLRAISKISAASRQAADEYGYVVTRMVKLTEAGITDIQDFTLDANVAKVSKAAYDKANSIDRVFKIDEINDEYFFTGVMVGIPVSRENYQDVLVFRPYTKFTDTNGKEYTTYGTAVSKSAVDICNAVFDEIDAEGVKPENQALYDYVESVIEYVEGGDEPVIP